MVFQPLKNPNRWIIVAMYLLPLGLVFLFWAASDSSHWAGGFVPLRYRMLIALWNACGPFACVLADHLEAPYPLFITFAAIWTGWIALVLSTRLREMPYILQFLLSLLWCLSGFPAASLVIT